jgi:hypothetical protein
MRAPGIVAARLVSYDTRSPDLHYLLAVPVGFRYDNIKMGRKTRGSDPRRVLDQAALKEPPP